MGDVITLQMTNEPIILQYAKQGIQGLTGPQGERGSDGTTWEVTVHMSNAPDGKATISLYKDGELCNEEVHYAAVQTLAYDGNDFVSAPDFDRLFQGSYTFNYTNVRAIFITVYEDSSLDHILCARACNFGKAATIQVGSVQAGQTASVTNSGTPLDAIFNFVLPKGDKGDTGDSGATLSYEAETETLVFTPSDENLGNLAYLDTIDYSSAVITNKPTLGALSGLDSIDYESQLITNKPTLGALSAYDTIDYESELLINKPYFGEMAGYDDAESDGELYVRQDNQWVPITLGAMSALDSIDYESTLLTNKPVLGTMSAIDDAPTDDEFYLRKNGEWESVSLPQEIGSMAAVDDAPSDGGFYVRQNGSWVEITLPTSEPEPGNGNDEETGEESGSGTESGTDNIGNEGDAGTENTDGENTTGSEDTTNGQEG